MSVTNLFAYRSTDPKQLKRVNNPIGPENDAFIIRNAQRASKVICAWGANGPLFGRSGQVARLLTDRGVFPYVLRLTKSGEPCRPLYLHTFRTGCILGLGMHLEARLVANPGHIVPSEGSSESGGGSKWLTTVDLFGCGGRI